ncbi:hypothetical protein F1559_003225 [Cyanidiococcus yangmingshanensis]|uniref:VOC domain-containing protein n=1 Tax=Cyanidiococcus yangmingshanensis TaxID=2690220 RepID=A0A7J7IJN8_9RHOD|nr:hypothetical protein F1559_003225 [Cyanidiococcus yangmingshanensis]
MASLWRGVLLLVTNLERSLTFYTQALGLRVTQRTEQWAALDAPNGAIELHETDTMAFSITGYSPLLRFQVANLDDTIRDCLAHGAVMDGPVRRTLYGASAVTLRAPDGHVLALYHLEAGEGGQRSQQHGAAFQELMAAAAAKRRAPEPSSITDR